MRKSADSPTRHSPGQPRGWEVSGDDVAARKSLSRLVVEQAAERLRVMAECNRIVLLEALRDGEAGVQELADRIALPHQNVSHHLGILWRAGVVSRRREGTVTLYAVEDWSAWWVIEQIVRQVEPGDDDLRLTQ